MKKQKIFPYAAFAILSISALAGCNNDPGVYNVKYINYDGTLLQENVGVEKNSEVAYAGNKPVHYDDSSSYYVFKGWDKEPGAITADTTYTAVYESHPLNTVPENPDSYVDALPEATKDGTILHAFCWSFENIKRQLPFIRDAGYKSIQTLPVSVPKSNGSSWMMFYQPLAFRIADGKESPLGTKQDLIDLCEEAEKYDISIIVDVVFNHMANVGSGSVVEKEDDGTPKVYEKVGEYEPYIYEHRNDAENPTFHHVTNPVGSGTDTQAYSFGGGLPDLNTGNEYVQERALAFLKECIDVGVDGFRFDAAKHIETPDDPNYASDFWPNTLGVAKEYYKEKTGNELFAYGEVLGGPAGRSIDVYTKLMNVTEDYICDEITSGVSGRNANRIIKAKYGKGDDPTKLVGWLESHDTYMESTNPWSNLFMSRAWATMNARKGLANLYLARPSTTVSGDVPMGEITDYYFKEESLGAVNRFHNRFLGADELAQADGSIYYIERFNENDKGAVVVDTAASKKVVVDFAKLGTDVYYDQITGKAVTVRNGHATIELDESGISVLTKSKNIARPSFEVDNRGGLFAKNKEVTVTAKNATSIKYQINGGDIKDVATDGKITITQAMAVENLVTLKVIVSNAQFTVSEEYYFTPVAIIEGYLNVLNFNEDYFDDYEVYMWSWPEGGNGHWSQDYTRQGTTLLVDTDELGITGGLLFALVEKGTTVDEPTKWDSAKVVRQTPNVTKDMINEGIADLSQF